MATYKGDLMVIYSHYSPSDDINSILKRALGEGHPLLSRLPSDPYEELKAVEAALADSSRLFEKEIEGRVVDIRLLLGEHDARRRALNEAANALISAGQRYKEAGKEDVARRLFSLAGGARSEARRIYRSPERQSILRELEQAWHERDLLYERRYTLMEMLNIMGESKDVLEREASPLSATHRGQVLWVLKEKEREGAPFESAEKFIEYIRKEGKPEEGEVKPVTLRQLYRLSDERLRQLYEEAVRGGPISEESAPAPRPVSELPISYEQLVEQQGPGGIERVTISETLRQLEEEEFLEEAYRTKRKATPQERSRARLRKFISTYYGETPSETRNAARLEPGQAVEFFGRPYRIIDILGKEPGERFELFRARLEPVTVNVEDLDLKYTIRLKDSTETFEGIARSASDIIADAFGISKDEVTKFVQDLRSAATDETIAADSELPGKALTRNLETFSIRYIPYPEAQPEIISLQQAVERILSQTTTIPVEGVDIPAPELTAEIIKERYPQMLRVGTYELEEFIQNINLRIAEAASAVTFTEKELNQGILKEDLAKRLKNYVLSQEGAIWEGIFGPQTGYAPRIAGILRELSSQGKELSTFEEFLNFIRSAAAAPKASEELKDLAALDESALRSEYMLARRMMGIEKPLYYETWMRVVELMDPEELREFAYRRLGIDIFDPILDDTEKLERWVVRELSEQQKILGDETGEIYAGLEEFMASHSEHETFREFEETEYIKSRASYRIARGIKEEVEDIYETLKRSLSKEELKELARELGIDVRKFKKTGALREAVARSLVGSQKGTIEREIYTNLQRKSQETLSEASRLIKLPEGFNLIWDESGRIVGFEFPVRSQEQLAALRELDELFKRPEMQASYEAFLTAKGLPAELRPGYVEVADQRLYYEGTPLELRLQSGRALRRLSEEELARFTMLPSEEALAGERPIFRRLDLETGRLRWLGVEAEPFARELVSTYESGGLMRVPMSYIDVETWLMPGKQGFGLTQIAYTLPRAMADQASAEIVTHYVKPTPARIRQINQILDLLEQGKEVPEDLRTGLRHIMKFAVPEWETAPITREAVHRGLEFLQEHGIPQAEALRRTAKDLAEAKVIAGHNVGFDIEALETLSKRTKSPISFSGRGVINTRVLANIVLPTLPNYELGTVAKALGVSLEGAHLAAADVAATAAVAEKLIPETVRVLKEKGALEPVRIGETFLAVRPRRVGTQWLRAKEYYTLRGMELFGTKARLILENAVTREILTYENEYGKLTTWFHETFMPETVDRDLVERVIRDRARRNLYRRFVEQPLRIVRGRLISPGLRLFELAKAQGLIDSGNVSAFAEVNSSILDELARMSPGMRLQLSAMRERLLQEEKLMRPMLERLYELGVAGAIDEKTASRLMREFMSELNRLAPPEKTLIELKPFEQELIAGGMRFNVYSPQLIERDINAYLGKKAREILGKPLERAKPEEKSLAWNRALYERLLPELHTAGLLTEEELSTLTRLDETPKTPTNPYAVKAPAVRSYITQKLLEAGAAVRAGAETGPPIETHVEADLLGLRPREAVEELLEKPEGGASKLEALINKLLEKYALAPASKPPITSRIPRADRTFDIAEVAGLLESKELKLTEEEAESLRSLLDILGFKGEAKPLKLPEDTLDAVRKEISQALSGAGPSSGTALLGTASAAARSLTRKPLLFELAGSIGRAALPFLPHILIGGGLYLAGKFFTNAPLEVDKRPEPDEAPSPDGTFQRRRPNTSAALAPVIRQMQPRSYVVPNDSGYSGVKLKVRAQGRKYVRPEDIQAAMADAVKQGVPFDVNINTNLYDNTSEIDEAWLDEKIAEVLSK